MDISKACMAPIQPPISGTDRAHPLFAQYQAYRAGFSAKLIECASFPDWLSQKAQAEYWDSLTASAQYPAFVKWMRETKGGTPGKTHLVWPANFLAWCYGVRW